MFGGAISVARGPYTFQESASQSVCLAPKVTPASLDSIAKLCRPDVWVFARRPWVSSAMNCKSPQ